MALELRRIEVERIKAERWNGQLPEHIYASALADNPNSCDRNSPNIEIGTSLAAKVCDLLQSLQR